MSSEVPDCRVSLARACDGELLNPRPSAAPKLAISVIIPTYRRPDLVGRCLASVAAAVRRFSAQLEVLVVDDGSGDSATHTLATTYSWASFLILPSNRGYPGAVNAGAAVTQGEWILTLNNDTEIDRDVLSALWRAARDNPGVGHLAAQQRFSHDPIRLCSAGLVLDRLGVNAERLIGEPLVASETTTTDVFGASGGAAMYRRTMFKQLGGLDESFVFGLEDADFAWRAQMRGWRCLYVPDAVVFHDYGGTVRHGSEYRFLQAGRNRVRLVLKNADSRMLRRYGIAMLAYDLAYISYALLKHRTLAPLKGRLEVLREWRAIRAAGANGRQAIELAPILGLRAALRRRAAWLHD
jgi:GT2 family glycosyltransferase